MNKVKEVVFSKHPKDSEHKSLRLASGEQEITEERRKIIDMTKHKYQFALPPKDTPKLSKKIIILKNTRKIKLKSNELTFHGTNIKNTRNRESKQTQRVENIKITASGKLAKCFILTQILDKSNKSVSSLNSKIFEKEAIAFKLPPLDSDSGKGMYACDI